MSFRKPRIGDRVLCYGSTEGVVKEVGPTYSELGKSLSDEELLVTLEKDGREFEETVRKEEAHLI